MRKQTKPSVQALRACRANDARRRVANDFARFVRKQSKEGLPFREIDRRGDCFGCGASGRLFYWIKWQPLTGSAPHLGYWRNSDPICAVCAIGVLRASAGEELEVLA